MTKLNKALMATTAIAFASGLALPASAQDPSKAPGVVKSGEKIKLKLYGQITRQFGFVNDGESTTFKQGSNGNTSTRMGIDGRGKVTKDVKIRTRLEFAINTGKRRLTNDQVIEPFTRLGLEDVQRVEVETPYGKPSGTIVRGRLDRGAILSRRIGLRIRTIRRSSLLARQ